MRWKANPSIMSRKEDDDRWCLFNPVTSCIHLVSPLLYAIWKATDEPSQLESIAKAVSTQYDIVCATPDQLLELVRDAIKNLEERQLVEVER